MKISPKITTSLILISFLGIVLIYTTPAARGLDIWYFTEEFVIQPLVRKIANSLENKLVNKLTSFVAGVDSKTPRFILSWRNHLLESRGRGNDIFRATLADAELCDYFGDNLRKTFGADKYIGVNNGAIVKNTKGEPVFQNKVNPPGLPAFKNGANCTLPSNFKVDEFRKDFKNGGWAAWNSLVAPQNNYFGSLALALDEQREQIENEDTASQNEAAAGRGFLSQHLSSEGNSASIGCTDKNEDGATLTISRCIWQGEIVTPNQIIGDAAVNALDKKLGRVGGATKLTDVLLKLVDSVTTSLAGKLTSFSGKKSYEDSPSSNPFDETDVPMVDPHTDNLLRSGQGDCKRLCLVDQESKCVSTDQVCLDEAKTACDKKCSAIGQ